MNIDQHNAIMFQQMFGGNWNPPEREINPPEPKFNDEQIEQAKKNFVISKAAAFMEQDDVILDACNEDDFLLAAKKADGKAMLVAIDNYCTKLAEKKFEADFTNELVASYL